jgi:hypothetical protein
MIVSARLIGAPEEARRPAGMRWGVAADAATRKTAKALHPDEETRKIRPQNPALEAGHRSVI